MNKFIERVDKTKKLKVLFFDIETTPNISYTWGKYEQNVIEFIEEGHLLCFSWKFQGDKKVKALSLRDFKSGNKQFKSDYYLVKELHKLFDEADILVAHNGDNFDVKMANTFFIKNGLPPISEKKQIDTKKLAKSKFRFNSNKLDDIGTTLELGRKIKTDFDLWKGCMANDKKSWDKMIKYNKQDVVLLEKVFNEISPWCKLPIIYTTSKGCRLCGSQDLIQRGWSYMDSGKSRRKKFSCKKCGHWSFGELEKI